MLCFVTSKEEELITLNDNEPNNNDNRPINKSLYFIIFFLVGGLVTKTND